MKLLTLPFRLTGKLLTKLGQLLGRLGLRALKIAALSLVAGVALFILDWVLVKDTGHPGEPGNNDA